MVASSASSAHHVRPLAAMARIPNAIVPITNPRKIHSGGSWAFGGLLMSSRNVNPPATTHPAPAVAMSVCTAILRESGWFPNTFAALGMDGP